MPKKIYRYRLQANALNEIQTISIPFNSVLLDVKESCRPDIISLWYSADISSQSTDKQYVVCQTGDDTPQGLYLKTILINNNIRHIFQIK